MITQKRISCYAEVDWSEPISPRRGAREAVHGADPSRPGSGLRRAARNVTVDLEQAWLILFKREIVVAERLTVTGGREPL